MNPSPSVPDAAAHAVASSPPRPRRITTHPTAMIAPISGPTTYTQGALQSPLTTAGPNDRAGFIGVPPTGAAQRPARHSRPPRGRLPNRRSAPAKRCPGSRRPVRRSVRFRAAMPASCGSRARAAWRQGAPHFRHRTQKQRRQRRAGQLRQDVPRDTLLGKVAPQRKGDRHHRVEMRTRYGTREQDHRHHRQAGGDHGCRQADLTLGMERAATRRRSTSRNVPSTSANSRR